MTLSEKAREREKEAGSVGGSKGTTDWEDPSKGETAQKVAEQVGLGGKSTYYRLKKVMKDAQNGDEVAQEQVVELEKDRSIHGAYTTVREAQEEEGEGGMEGRQNFGEGEKGQHYY